MARSISDSFTLTLSVVLSLPDVQDIPEPMLTEQHLADPDESVDAAMDYALPRDGDPGNPASSATLSSDVYRLASG